MVKTTIASVMKIRAYTPGGLGNGQERIHGRTVQVSKVGLSELILQSQSLAEAEADELRQHRADIEAVLGEHFTDADPSIHYAG